MIDIKVILEYTRDLRVLYVEDEPVVAEQTLLLFSDYFDSIDHASDGKVGLEKYNDARNNAQEYDLIITDINMPNMSGIELCDAIYGINQEQKIIVISAHNEAHYLHQLINMGVDSFISKPIEISNIMKVFYSVCQSISDRKHLQQYYNEIEELNIALIKKNSELEKAFRMYDNMILKEKLHKPVEKKEPQDNAMKVDDTDRIELNDLVEHDLSELLDIHQEMDALILNMIMKENSDNMKEFGQHIEKYSAILSGYYTFYSLSASFRKLADTVLNEPVPQDNHQMHNILALLESFLFTLKRWQESWTSEHKTSANFFDDSLSSDIDTIVALWCQEDTFEDIEFF